MALNELLILFTVVGCILDLIDVRSSISGIDLNVFAGLLTLPPRFLIFFLIAEVNRLVVFYNQYYSLPLKEIVVENAFKQQVTKQTRVDALSNTEHLLNYCDRFLIPLYILHDY